LAVTLTNLGNVSQFLARITLTYRVIEKYKKSPVNTCTTLSNDDVIITSLKNAVFARRKNMRNHAASVVASKFAGFKSS